MKSAANIASLHRIVASEIASRNTDPLCYSLAVRSCDGQSEADVLKEYLRIRLQGLVSLREKRKKVGTTAMLRDVEIRRERDFSRERRELALTFLLSGASWIALTGAYLAFRLRAAGDLGSGGQRIFVFAGATVLCVLPHLYHWIRRNEPGVRQKAARAIHLLAILTGSVSFYSGIMLLKNG